MEFRWKNSKVILYFFSNYWYSIYRIGVNVMPKKNTTKKENENVDLEKTQKLDVDAIKKPDMESKNTKESQKKNSKTTTKNNKITSKKTSSKKKNNEFPKFEKEDVTITEIVSKINEEKRLEYQSSR